MRVFEFSDLTTIRACVLAANRADATRLFKDHVLAKGGNPDDLLWRGITLDHLKDAAQSAIREAMDLNREGLIISVGVDRLVFETPVGNRTPIEP